MGVSNYLFMLTLYDPDLRDVDPHDLEAVTPENEILRTKVMVEARRNVWYFLRECVRIYGQGGSPVPFRLDRGNCAMAWCFINGIDYVGMAPRQLGKCTDLDALIRTPHGWIRMGDIKVGDIVVTPDGGTADVSGVYPQGKKEVFRVYFEDGRWVDCSDDHLWKVHWPHWGEADGGKWRILQMREIREHLEAHSKSKNRLSIPLTKPEIKDDVDLPIDPYVLGVILGDGSISDRHVTITKPDPWLREEVNRLLPEGYKASEFYDGEKTFGISRDDTKEVPGFVRLLNDLGLGGTVSHTKFIPDIYMQGSEAQKRALLQGLMDTDGTPGTLDLCKDGVTPKHGGIEYSTTSHTLARQVQELIRSLGGLCKLSERQTYYTYKGERKKGRLSFRVCPRIANRADLFRLPRKKEIASTGAYKYEDSLKLAIRAIVPIGFKETQCIEVDHPEHLYLTNDYIVTHNTVGAVSLVSWVMYSSGEEFQIGHVAKDNTLREENVKRVRGIAENLPKWWIHENKFRDKKNTSEVYYHALKTHFQTGVAQADPRKADLQARGNSQPVQWIDEAEFCINIGISYPTMIASTTAARENAKMNGKPYSNLITTTAGDPSNAACREAAKILDGAMPFAEQLYDLKDNDHLHEVVAANSPQKMIIGVFSHLQLGKTNEWLAAIIKRTNSTREQVMRDYLNRRVSIQEKPIIPELVLASINASQREHSYLEIMSSKFVLYWYLDKEYVESQAFRDRPIIVGCDSSEMIGRDATTLVGIDPLDLSVVFTFRCSEGNINTVGVMIANLLRKYPKMVWVPENKSSGTSLIDIVSLMLVKEGYNPFTRIYNEIVQRKSEKEFQEYDIRDRKLLESRAKRYFGFKTDAAKRDKLYSDVLIRASEIAQHKIRDRVLCAELNSLTEKNGRVDHEEGGHDDTVIAFLLAAYFVLYGKHLDVYGIAPGTAMRNANVTDDDREAFAIQRQQAIMERVERTEEKIKYQQDPSMRKLLESDLRILKGLLENGPTPKPTTSDDLLRDPGKFADSSADRPKVSGEEALRNVKMAMSFMGNR